MANNIDRKKFLFDLYSSNLHMLVNNGLLLGLNLKYEKTYICPICLKQFCENDLDSSKSTYLTLEHVPPESLGGKHYLLTCNICNNGAGEDIDIHLNNRLLKIERNQFLPNSVFNVFVGEDKNRMQGELNISDKREMTLSLRDKNNDRRKIDKFNNSISDDPASRLIIVNPRIRKEIIYERIPVALLKIAYLLVFEKMGYLLILDNVYNRIRMQIQKPDYVIYPYKFWSIDEKVKNYYGVHLITDQALRSLYVIFPLATKKLILPITAFIPLPPPYHFTPTLLETLSRSFKYNSSYVMSLRYLPSYLKDIEANIKLEESLRKARIFHLGIEK